MTVSKITFSLDSDAKQWDKKDLAVKLQSLLKDGVDITLFDADGSTKLNNTEIEKINDAYKKITQLKQDDVDIKIFRDKESGNIDTEGMKRVDTAYNAVYTLEKNGVDIKSFDKDKTGKIDNAEMTKIEGAVTNLKSAIEPLETLKTVLNNDCDAIMKENDYNKAREEVNNAIKAYEKIEKLYENEENPKLKAKYKSILDQSKGNLRKGYQYVAKWMLRDKIAPNVSTDCDGAFLIMADGKQVVARNDCRYEKEGLFYKRIDFPRDISNVDEISMMAAIGGFSFNMGNSDLTPQSKGEALQKLAKFVKYYSGKELIIDKYNKVIFSESDAQIPKGSTVVRKESNLAMIGNKFTEGARHDNEKVTRETTRKILRSLEEAAYVNLNEKRKENLKKSAAEKRGTFLDAAGCYRESGAKKVSDINILELAQLVVDEYDEMERKVTTLGNSKDFVGRVAYNLNKAAKDVGLNKHIHFIDGYGNYVQLRDKQDDNNYSEWHSLLSGDDVDYPDLGGCFFGYGDRCDIDKLKELAQDIINHINEKNK